MGGEGREESASQDKLFCTNERGVTAVMNRTRPFRQSPKFPAFTESRQCFMMGIDKYVKEAQNYDTILKAPQEHTGVSRMKDVIQPGTLVEMSEGVRFIWVSNTASVVILCSVKSPRSTRPIT